MRLTSWYDDYWKRAEQAPLSADPSRSGRSEAILALWPAGARTAADVGCGRGEIVQALRAHGVRATGLDISRDAAPAAQANLTALPLKTGAVDLVLACEVLEHMPAQDLPRAVQELGRVARRWVVVTVPLDEQLDLEQSTCAQCHGRFNSSGHLRIVRREDVLGWFAGWTLAAEQAVGVRKRIWGPAARLLATLQGDRNLSWEEGGALCPMCGTTTPFTTPQSGLWPEALLRIRGLLWRLGRPTPHNGVYLFSR